MSGERSRSAVTAAVNAAGVASSVHVEGVTAGGHVRVRGHGGGAALVSSDLAPELRRQSFRAIRAYWTLEGELCERVGKREEEMRAVAQEAFEVEVVLR